MSSKPEKFAELVAQAMQNSNVNQMRAVVEKEILHYDILFALEDNGFLTDLVFQGGTSLRLCYGGNRFSEDLDFAGGPEFTSAKLSKMKSSLEKYIDRRYGLEVNVKEPKELRKDPKYAELNVDKWQISVVTSPERKDLPRQKIKLEIANVPAYTKIPLPLLVNYDFLPDGYGDTLILTETLDEVLADKVIALPATQKYVRYRDLWDLAWLQQQGAKLDIQLVKNKINDYQLNDYENKVNILINRLPTFTSSNEFLNEMKRFIPANVFERTLGKQKFQQYLTNTLLKLFIDVKEKLASNAENQPFIM